MKRLVFQVALYYFFYFFVAVQQEYFCFFRVVQLFHVLRQIIVILVKEQFSFIAGHPVYQHINIYPEERESEKIIYRYILA